MKTTLSRQIKQDPTWSQSYEWRHLHQINFKVEICSALYIFDSHHTLQSPRLITIYNHSFHNTFDYNHFIYRDYLLCTVAASAHLYVNEYL